MAVPNRCDAVDTGPAAIRRLARAEPQRICDEVAVAGGSVANRLDLLRRGAQFVGGHVANGHVDPSTAGDMLRDAAVCCGLVNEAGDDAVQEAIATGIQLGERDRFDERSADSLSPGPIVRCAADIEPEAISWLWPGRMALGKIGLLAGLPGVGKSQLTCWLAATVTTGGRWPDGGTAPRGSVIMIGCEDDAGDTVVPRLLAAGADLQRVHILDWAVDAKSRQRRHFDVQGHIDQLMELVRRLGDARLIVIDPITAYMGRADTHVTADVRGALAPLQTGAAELGAAVLLISHLTKAVDGTAMARVTGSGAFVALSRSAYLAGYDPSDETRQRRVLASIRCSLAVEPPALAYTVESVMLPSGITTSRVIIDPAPLAVSADDIARATRAPSGDHRSELDDARTFLLGRLADGPQPTADVKAAARAAGIAWRTVERARAALGVESRKDGASGAWRMHMPTGR